MENELFRIKESIGNTPLIRLKKIEEKYNLHAHVYCKLESHNLTGSVKDRAVFYMIKELIDKGILDKSKTIIEPTSGNTGISLSYICNLLGIKVLIVMPKSMSLERRRIIKRNGAQLVLIDGGMKDCVEYVNKQIRVKSNYVTLNQFENTEGIKAHYETTGPEIFSQLNVVDCIVAGVGTGATISGIGKYLKGINTNIKIVGVEPTQSPLLTQGFSKPHKIEGIGPNFISKLFLGQYVDEIIDVDETYSIELAKEIYDIENIYCGVSSGAALLGALTYLKCNKKVENIVVVFPDSGDRYSW